MAAFDFRALLGKEAPVSVFEPSDLTDAAIKVAGDAKEFIINRLEELGFDDHNQVMCFALTIEAMDAILEKAMAGATENVGKRFGERLREEGKNRERMIHEAKHAMRAFIRKQLGLPEERPHG
jgi:hypothetical protein